MDLMAVLIFQISQSGLTLPNNASSRSNLQEREVGTGDTVSPYTANHLSLIEEQRRESLWSYRWKRLEIHQRRASRKEALITSISP